ncbi:MAG TPA: succinylglutamate desuccinylase, partial [Usitatibacteraceae bacterium]|nr:succinylglutamate desuccinylase [Usitatibacteraceae bacterium]
VDGWLETYARGVERRKARAGANPATRAAALNADPKYGVGTTEYMRSTGGCAITLECGQHEDPAAPEVAYHAIRNALAHLALADLPAPAPVAEREYLSLVDVIDRLDAKDAFAKEWSSFNRLAAGELIGTRADGTEVRAPEDGYIVFPDHKALAGNEWFYLARPRRAEEFPG